VILCRILKNACNVPLDTADRNGSVLEYVENAQDVLEVLRWQARIFRLSLFAYFPNALAVGRLLDPVGSILPDNNDYAI
jgi:hypothetical protein